MMLAAAAAAPSPWWWDFLADAGLGVGLLLMGLAFLKYGLPKIIGMVNEAFRKMQADFKTALTDTQATFSTHIERQEERHSADSAQQRADFLADRALDREAQKEATNAAQQTAIQQARLSDSMDSLRGEIRVLTGSFKLPAATRLKPAEPHVKAVAE